MNYEQYLAYRDRQGQIGSLKDAGDLDLYGKFRRAEIQPAYMEKEVYRCHLVEDFLERFNLDIDKSLIAYSRGVRHSLSILMEDYKDKSWILPGDNYPFYQKQAKETGLKTSHYETLPTASFADLRRSSQEGDVLLATYPFKPSGGSYSVFDWTFLQHWLDKDANRRLILDAVYVMDLSAEKVLWDFFTQNEQVIVLYSLSKAFAAPNVAGFTFAKDPDIRERFKALSKDADSLRLAFSLLNTEYGQHRKDNIEQFINAQWLKAVELELIPASSSSNSYLFYSNVVHTRHLKDNILTVPASVFGSHRNTAVISTLGL